MVKSKKNKSLSKKGGNQEILQLLNIEAEIIDDNIVKKENNNYFKTFKNDYDLQQGNDFFNNKIKEIIYSDPKPIDDYPELVKFILDNKKKTIIKKEFTVLKGNKYSIDCTYHDYNKEIVLNYEYNFFNNIDNLIRTIENFNNFILLMNDQHSITNIEDYSKKLIDKNNHYELGTYADPNNGELIKTLNNLFFNSISLEDNIYCYKCFTNANKLKDHINHITYFNIFFADAYQEYTRTPDDSSDKYIYRITIMKGSKVLFYDKYIIISSNSYVFFNDNDGDKFINQSNNINLPYDIYPNKSTFKSIDVIIRNNIYSIENRNISEYLSLNDTNKNLVIAFPLKIEKDELKISYPNFNNELEKIILENHQGIKDFFLNKKDNTFQDYKNINENSEISFFQENEKFSFIAILHPKFEDINVIIQNENMERYEIFYWYYYNIYSNFNNKLGDNVKELCLFPILVPDEYKEYKNDIYSDLVKIFFYLNIEFNINPKIFFHEDDNFQLFKKTIEYYNNNCINVEKRKLNFNNDSCYMDCFFYILFNTKNKFIEEFILKAPVTICVNNDNRNELHKLGKEIKKKLIEIYNFFNNKY